MQTVAVEITCDWATGAHYRVPPLRAHLVARRQGKRARRTAGQEGGAAQHTDASAVVARGAKGGAVCAHGREGSRGEGSTHRGVTSIQPVRTLASEGAVSGEWEGIGLGESLGEDDGWGGGRGRRGGRGEWASGDEMKGGSGGHGSEGKEGKGGGGGGGGNKDVLWKKLEQFRSLARRQNGSSFGSSLTVGEEVVVRVSPMFGGERKTAAAGEERAVDVGDTRNGGKGGEGLF